MAREQSNPKDPNWKHYHARATLSLETIHAYTWTCQGCKTVNTTRINPSDPRSKLRCYRGVEARCGHCHGNIIRLTDSTGLTWDPYDA